MTETFPTPEGLLVPDPYFLKPPFCNPEASLSSGYDIVANFDPRGYLGESAGLLGGDQFAQTIFRTYEYTKRPAERPDDLQPNTLDLAHPFSVNSIAQHVLCHAVTGDVRHGVSNSRVIPYWDREATIAGLLQVEPDLAASTAMLEKLDALCINVLRVHSVYYLAKLQGRADVLDLIQKGMARGQTTKEDSRPEQFTAIEIENKIIETDKTHAAAKLKQLLWLVDQQPGKHIRDYMLPTLVSLTDDATNAGITKEELGLDMGADTGISGTTSRPPYIITGIVQLGHVESDSYSVPQHMCHRLTLDEVLQSIDRPDRTLPHYETDGRYRLPLRFEQPSPAIRTAHAITDLLVHS